MKNDTPDQHSRATIVRSERWLFDNKFRLGFPNFTQQMALIIKTSVSEK